jgi:hypothetical protein
MLMRMGRVVHILAFLLVLVMAFALINLPGLGTGTIEGTVSIGPWTPVEPVGGSHPPPEVYTSRQIILEGPLLPRTEIPINGTGYFRAEVRSGTYTLTMSDCSFLGCSRVFPMTVTINPGQTTVIQINIDTGIR